MSVFYFCYSSTASSVSYVLRMKILCVVCMNWCDLPFQLGCYRLVVSIEPAFNIVYFSVVGKELSF